MTFRALFFLPLFALTVSLSAAQQDAMLPVPLNLQKEAAQAQAEGKPLVLMFSLPGCPYCKVVRQNYLAPMLTENPESERPVLREVHITSDRPLVGFDGSQTSQSALASRYDVRIAPTLIFVDARGDLLADPIVGGDGTGFYLAYLDSAFAASAKKLLPSKRVRPR